MPNDQSRRISSFHLDSRLPARGGVGLKLEHASEFVASRPDTGFLEIHAENYMGDGGPPHVFLTDLRRDYPLSIHGVALSLGGESPLDRDHLRRLAALIDRYAPDSFSEHLAWSIHDGVFFNDLLPVPLDSETLQRVVEHVQQVQDYLARRLLLENPSTYFSCSSSTWDEVEFLSEIVRRTGCGLLLDVNNVQVSCVNNGRDPIAYLDAFPTRAIGEVHLAGYSEEADSLGGRLLIDAHDRPVTEDVWDLFHYLIERTGPLPTLIEWDNDVPSLSTLLRQSGRADSIMMARTPQPTRVER